METLEDSQLCNAIALFGLIDIYELAFFWSRMISCDVDACICTIIIIIITWKIEREKEECTQRD